MKKTQVFLLTIGYVMAFAYYGCKKSEAPAPGSEAAVEATVQTEAPGSASKAYAGNDTYFKLPNYKGGEIDLAAYAGKPVLLMFFTENCPYCRKAAPFINRVAREYAPKGLNTVGICLESDSSAAAGFAKSFDLNFPIAYKGQEAARRYKAQGVPYIYLLTKNHVIHNVWAGYDPEFDTAIKEGIEAVIK